MSRSPTRSTPRPARKPKPAASRGRAEENHTKVFRAFVRQLERLDAERVGKDRAR